MRKFSLLLSRKFSQWKDDIGGKCNFQYEKMSAPLKTTETSEEAKLISRLLNFNTRTIVNNVYTLVLLENLRS